MGYHVTGLTHVSRSSQPIAKPHLKRRILLIAFAVFVLMQLGGHLGFQDTGEGRRSDLLNAPETRAQLKSEASNDAAAAPAGSVKPTP